MLALRCPRCREGEAFRGLLDMRERCDACGLVFEREPGYFTGAMVVAYALAVVVYAAATLVLWRTLLPAELALLVAVVPLLVAAPAIFRWSRVIWMHIDHALDPDRG